MKTIFAVILTLTLFGCGNTKTQTQEQITNSSLEEIVEESIQNPISLQTPPPKVLHKTVTIYIHGYSKSGYKRVGIYGNDNYDEIINTIVDFSGFNTTTNYDENNFSNIIAITPYYGNIAPNYYTAKDIKEIEDIGEGIPRYALIIAKYAKHIMIETGADSINLLSVSMGSLVSRYLIEKDLEQLSSNKKILKWLSLEGVIKGNIAASGDNLLSFVNNFETQPVDVKHMSYAWIDEHLNSSSPYYNNIQIGFESSTNDNASKGALSLWLRANQHFEANDGVQAVKDTFFTGDFPHTFYHDNHYTLAENKAVWGYAATFFTAKKRVRITLINASLSDLHEDKLPFNTNILPAEIIFESTIHAPFAEEKWGFERAIDERVLEGKYLTVYDFLQQDSKQPLDQTLFDSYILEEEQNLQLTLTPYELDREPDYGLYEITGHGEHESLGTMSIMIPLKEGIYPLQSEQWSAEVSVEIIDY